jgi:murein L,D-transpeptidase YafK
MTIASLVLSLSATKPLLLGAALAGAPTAGAAFDSTVVRSASAASAAASPAADSAGSMPRDEARAVAMARASATTAAKANLAVAEKRVLPAPTFRRKIKGRLVADSVVVWKAARKMTLFYRGDSVAVYLVALGRNPVGHKERQGDGRTPEGVYRIEARNPASKYHLSLRVSYPSATDRVRAAQRGVSAGNDIMIHGLPPAFSRYGARHRAWDWTEGCIAVTDQEIEEIYQAVQLGAVINIKP